MPSQLLLLLLLLLHHHHHLLLSAQPVPDTLQPSLLLPPDSPPTTIPALPAESDDTSACPLDLPSDLLHTISAACAADGGTGTGTGTVTGNSNIPSRSRCCPAIAATLLSAYSAAALSAARALPTAGYDLPVLPDDSETCVAAGEEALRMRGVALPRVNATCGVAYCYCGVRLRRLECAGSFVESAAEGRWVPMEDEGRRLENDCARSGLVGCSRCLGALNQLKSRPAGNLTLTKQKTGDDMECRLMGLTWLLSVNRTRYFDSATAILRTFMKAADSRGNSTPASCSLSSDDLPFAVSSSQVNGNSSSSIANLSLFSPSFCLLFLLIIVATLV